ncbi:MAG TPA: protein kinase [Pirellulaceae bacterium]|nr:protein kinase [Pirellulaceae bacterium]
MPDWVNLSFQQGIQAESDTWYNNLQRLGSGGNAVTYLMASSGGQYQGVCFAVKVFRRVSMPDRRESFLGEVRFLRTCDHPCVMRIYDEGVYREDHPFVVAEYLPQTLLDVIRADSPTLVEKLSYALQLLSTLAYLDTKAVIHRDIKPQNIFVKGRSCVLGDFGLMKRLPHDEEIDVRQTTIKESVGVGMPFFYRTPDQVAYARGDANLTTKSDIFQLGLVIAQLFSGRNPERRAEHDDFLSDVLLEPKEAWITQIPFGFRDSIAGLIESMLIEDPENRPTAAELVDPWRGIFFAAAQQQSALEGRVFR